MALSTENAGQLYLEKSVFWFAAIVKMKPQKWIYFKSVLPESVFRKKWLKNTCAASILFLKYNKNYNMLSYYCCVIMTLLDCLI